MIRRLRRSTLFRSGRRRPRRLPPSLTTAVDAPEPSRNFRFQELPDRADLAFDRGVTAIVGPNGCGKSNVVDAITWVLGEQSAKSLRGDHMQDVIFSGSDARKPTAAAEVRLRLHDVPTLAARQAATSRDPALGASPADG